MKLNNTKTNKSQSPTPLAARVVVSIVSHGHSRNIAEELKPHTWTKHRNNIVPIVLTNLPDGRLEAYCQKYDIPLLINDSPAGFGANNNRIFSYAKSKLKLHSNDYFFCINPDVLTTAEDIIKIAKVMQTQQYTVAAPNLAKPDGTPDDNIRAYPRLHDILVRYLFNSQRTCVKDLQSTTPRKCDWASGAFLCFQSSVFEQIEGFDERYFMYYEDTDICLRAKLSGQPTWYLPEVTAIHIGNRRSRGLPTKQFLHHAASALRFIVNTRQL